MLDLRIAEVKKLSAERQDDKVIALVAAIDENRAHLSQAERDALDLAALQSGMRTEAASAAIDRAIKLHRSEGGASRLLGQLCNHVHARGTIEQIDAVIELSRKDLDLALRVSKLTERRAFLVRKAGF